VITALTQQESEKPSVGNSTVAQPEEFTIFLDNDTGSNAVVQALRSQGVRVELLKDHFQPETEDTVWIPEVSR
jgi:hypothetical protein